MTKTEAGVRVLQRAPFRLAERKGHAMNCLGLLLACDHYPAVAATPDRLDGQLRAWLAALGHELAAVSVFACHLGDFPGPNDRCGLWIVSGAPLFAGPAACADHARLLRHIRRAARDGQPVFGLNHGEHVLHDALCTPGAPTPPTPRLPRSIRNPFRSFLTRDALFAYRGNSVVALPRPAAVQPSGVFGRAIRVS